MIDYKKGNTPTWLEIIGSAVTLAVGFIVLYFTLCLLGWHMLTDDELQTEIDNIVRECAKMFPVCLALNYFKQYKEKMAVARKIKTAFDVPYNKRVKYLETLNIYL